MHTIYVYMPNTLPLNSSQYRSSIADFKWIKCLAQGLNPLLRMRLKPGTTRSHATAIPTKLMCIWFSAMHACLIYSPINVWMFQIDVSVWDGDFFFLLFFFFIIIFFVAHTILFVYAWHCFLDQMTKTQTSAVWAMWLKCLAQGHIPLPWPKLEPGTLRSKFQGSIVFLCLVVNVVKAPCS